MIRIFLGFPLFVFLAGPVAAAVISPEPSSLNVGVGQSFSLDVDVSNVTDLYAFQFDLDFNPSVLSAVSIVEGNFRNYSPPPAIRVGRG